MCVLQRWRILMSCSFLFLPFHQLRPSPSWCCWPVWTAVLTPASTCCSAGCSPSDWWPWCARVSPSWRTPCRRTPPWSAPCTSAWRACQSTDRSWEAPGHTSHSSSTGGFQLCEVGLLRLQNVNAENEKTNRKETLSNNRQHKKIIIVEHRFCWISVFWLRCVIVLSNINRLICLVYLYIYICIYNHSVSVRHRYVLLC